ncbi:hypothetical protein D9598_19945 [Roseomonas sp. KE0001]|nr:hypothetical protein [Roseomonas sp. KE0001]
MRLRAVALLLAKPALRAPEALNLLIPEHPAMRLDQALAAARAAIELRRQPVTAHETDEWAEWRGGRRDEALAPLRACAAARIDLTDTAEGLFVAPTSEAALAQSIASLAGTLLRLLERA